MKEDNPTEQPARLGTGDSFNFGCRKDLSCFNMCCRDINLFLTPYDIVRIKRRLNITSADFLRTYTMPLFPPEIGHPVILMKMMPDTKNCPFVGEEGCLIYDDRPWSCRSFPLEPVTGGDRPAFEIIKRDFCLGFEKGKDHSIAKWRATQNLGLYEEVNEEWKKVTHHENFPSRNLLEGFARDVFFLGSYNIDEFRDMVVRGDFLKYFDVERRVLKAVKSNETELLKFAFGWIRHVLFGDPSLKRR